MPDLWSAEPCELLNSEDLGEGTVSEAVAFPRKIVESALKNNATTVIMAHNNPGGVPEPSENDDRLMTAVRKALINGLIIIKT